jgi:DNA polymerase III subunit delta
MKLTSKQIPAHLKAPMKDCRATLIYGPDEGQVREYARDLAKQVVADPADPFSCVELNEDTLKTEPTRLHDELFALNMLGGQRLVRLEASAEATGKLLADIYDAEAVPEAYLLVTAGELTPRSSLRALFERHAKLAALPCYKDEGYQIDNLIQQKLREGNIRAEREAMQYLAANLGSDRRVSLSELDKIVLYCGDGGTLSADEAIDLVGNSAELTLDDLCNALADGNIRAVDRIMQKLVRENTQPIQILRALQRYFLRLHLLVSKIRSQGISADQAIADIKPKVFFKQVPVLRKQLGMWSLPMLEKALLLLTRAEQASKETGSSPEAQLQHYSTEILALLYKSRKAA